jgi:hypothetical protein
MFSKFNTIVSEAKENINTTNADLEGRIHALNERASAAQAEVESLTNEYDAALLADKAEAAAEVRQRLEVQRDLCAALERQVRPLLEQREEHRAAAVGAAAEKIAQAVNGPGNDAIRMALTTAEALREQYLAALAELQTIQHGVAIEARKLPRMCSEVGASTPTARAERYWRPNLLIDETHIAEAADIIPLF